MAGGRLKALDGLFGPGRSAALAHAVRALRVIFCTVSWLRRLVLSSEKKVGITDEFRRSSWSYSSGGQA
ncbi:hypothetical protein [Bradyrhizobium sp. STM 3562]|uniref:hypothetical protein n=1 Tax=Bradyrhizobium sp. STM 3562 TaxID=578924 RepID=UPI00388E253B